MAGEPRATRVRRPSARGRTAPRLGVARVSEQRRARPLRDLEDSFLAEFDRGVDELATIATVAWAGERDWALRIRAALGALLAALEARTALSQLLFVEALGAGPRVLARRARVMEELAGAVDQGRRGVRAGRELPPLTAEGVVGATVGVIHARLLEQDPVALTALLDPLVSIVVLPYRGRAAAVGELSSPGAAASGSNATGGRSLAWSGEPAGTIDFRLTARAHMVLTAVAELSGRELIPPAPPSNREISQVAGIRDQGQISKLLARLKGHGLIHNTGGACAGVPNAWALTARGEEILSATRAREGQPA